MSEVIHDVIDVVTKISNVKNDNRNCKSISYEYNSGKDYYAINFEFEYCNAKYSDCIVFYPSDFDKENILSSLANIINKSEKLVQ